MHCLGLWPTPRDHNSNPGELAAHSAVQDSQPSAKCSSVPLLHSLWVSGWPWDLLYNCPAQWFVMGSPPDSSSTSGSHICKGTWTRHFFLVLSKEGVRETYLCTMWLEFYLSPVQAKALQEICNMYFAPQNHRRNMKPVISSFPFRMTWQHPKNHTKACNVTKFLPLKHNKKTPGSYQYIFPLWLSLILTLLCITLYQLTAADKVTCFQ